MTPHLHIAIPAHGNSFLTRTALWAIAHTMEPRSYTVWVVESSTNAIAAVAQNQPDLDFASPVHNLSAPPELNGSRANGKKLDLVLGRPEVCGWLFVMHNDAAPLLPGWWDWLHAKLVRENLERASFGPSGNVGAVYLVSALRHLQLPFQPLHDEQGRLVREVGDNMKALRGAVVNGHGHRPWWLRDSDVAFDEQGRLLFAHLGGGTIGATRRRLPTRLWPWFVRRHVRRTV